ncbi:MAG: FliH/SctL family protein [Nocardioides sp.]
MSSSSEAVLRGDEPYAPTTTLRSVDRPDLRTGNWTRLGDESVLGDDITETALGGLAERARAAAQAQGYATGWGEGRREALAAAAELAAQAEERARRAEERREDEHAAAVDALALAADRLRLLTEEVCERIAAQATELAFEVTSAVLGREVTLAEDPAADAVRRAVAALPEEAPARVRLHPDVAATAATELAAYGVRVLPDASLERADAVVETDDTVVDLRVSRALDRLREVLG